MLFNVSFMSVCFLERSEESCHQVTKHNLVCHESQDYDSQKSKISGDKCGEA